MTEFLSSRREEVQDAMMDLYNEEAIGRNYEREIRQEAMRKGRIEGEQKGRVEGRKEGRIEGMEKGIQAMVEVLKGVSLSRETVVRTIADKFGLPPQAAEDKVAQYW